MSPMPPDVCDAPAVHVEPLKRHVKKFSNSTKDVVYSEDDVKMAVKEGMRLIIFQGSVYNVMNWAKHHPGGELSISHLYGKDATDYIIAFHPKKVITDMLPRFLVGKYKGKAMAPKDALISQKFDELTKKVEKEYMDIDANYYRALLARYCVQMAACLLSCFYLPNIWNAVIGGFFMASVWQQVAFYCHDSGHNGVTHNRGYDYTVGVLLASCVGGLSMGWWKDSHNVHHIITNHPEHDPDVQHMPVFAISEKYLNEDKPVYSTYHKRTMHFDFLAKVIIPYQHYCYVIINAFGRFLLYGLSWSFVIKGDKPEASRWRGMEAGGMVIFATWYIGLCRTAFSNTWEAMLFVLVSHLAASILHLQINVSHYGMDTKDVECEEHFATKALRTTMDVSTPEWFDWFHGGLQFQVIHHLFPRVPRHNLRKVKPLVLKFCEETGLEYIEYPFLEGQYFVVSHLSLIARHCWLLMSTAGEQIHV